MRWQISEEANSFLAANMSLYFIVVYFLNVDNALCSACGKMIYRVMDRPEHSLKTCH